MFLISSTFLHSKISLLKQKKTILVKGPLGLLKVNFSYDFQLKYLKSSQFCLTFNDNLNSVLQNTYLSLLTQKIRGVVIGFFEVLSIRGIGWRVEKSKNILIFYLGFSHSNFYKIPSEIEITILDSTNQCIKIFGLDFMKVQQVISTLRSLRWFNQYTGKGLYTNKTIVKLKSSSKSKS